MRFSNYGQVFETLCYEHRGGVRVEVFYFFPDIPDDVAATDYSVVSWFLGHLRTPEPGNADADFVTVPVANGFRSAQLLLPNRPHASNCTFYFGGELSYEEVIGNPCDYNRHLTSGQQTALGGARGTLNGSDPWTFCEHTKEACLRILGDTESYGGDDTVIETTLIGGGEHKTRSTTVGNETRLKDPIRVIYGERHVASLFLLSFAKEKNPSEGNQDAGTLRTLFEIGEGRIKSATNIKVMERTLPRPDGLGLELRLGGQRQAPTTFAPSVGNYNRRAHFRGDLNPINPNPIKAADIVAEADIEGRDEVKIYTDETTYTEEYTRLRAWCFLDLLTNPWFGHRMDKARFLMSDFIYLAGKGSPFDCDVQGTRSAQQQVSDICLAGLWYLPFNYDGYTRVLPIEVVDTEDDDVPLFTDALGPNCNILWDRERNVSRLVVSYKDDDQIPNTINLMLEDADHENIERPLVFEDWQQQYRAGLLYGDKSKRKIEATFPSYGLTHVNDARVLGQTLLQVGPFYQGGTLNNCSIEMAIDAVSADGLNLHENKVIEIVSNKLNPYLDADGNPFQFFIVTSLNRTSNLELIVKAQAYVPIDLATACQPAGGCEDVVWECLTHVTATGNDIREDDVTGYAGGSDGYLVAWAQSGDTQVLTGPGQYFQWTIPYGYAEHHVGVTPVDCPTCTGSPRCVFDRHDVSDHWAFYYRLDALQFCVVENDATPGGCNMFTGVTYAPGDTFALRWNDDDKIEYLHNDVVVFTSADSASGSLRLAFLAGTPKSVEDWPNYADTDWPAVNDAQFCSDSGGGSTQTDSAYLRWITPDDDVADGPHGVNTQIIAASPDHAAYGHPIPGGIDLADVVVARWTHTVAALPSYGHTYHLLTESVLASPKGFRVRWHGQGWIYSNAGVDTTTLPIGTIQVGDTLTFEYDRNGGSPVYRFKRNGVTLHTDTTGTIEPQPNLEGLCTNTGDLLGEVFWEIEYEGGAVCEFQQSPITSQSGGSTVQTSAYFDPLASETASQPDESIEIESGV